MHAAIANINICIFFDINDIKSNNKEPTNDIAIITNITKPIDFKVSIYMCVF